MEKYKGNYVRKEIFGVGCGNGGGSRRIIYAKVFWGAVMDGKKVGGN